jgi:hypothetical protein
VAYGCAGGNCSIGGSTDCHYSSIFSFQTGKLLKHSYHNGSIYLYTNPPTLLSTQAAVLGIFPTMRIVYQDAAESLVFIPFVNTALFVQGLAVAVGFGLGRPHTYPSNSIADSYGEKI